MDICMQELDALLAMVADSVDLNWCRDVDERYSRALRWEEVDRPPLVVQAAFGSALRLPEPWSKFRFYGYRETFQNPTAMLQNMLLERIVPGILLKDDSPLAIRNNHGTIQVGSLLGGKWQLHENNYPWIEPFRSTEVMERIADSNHLHVEESVMPRSLETLRFYQEKLGQFPPCPEAIQISLPDLQGPMDNAELLWGSDIYYAFTDCPELLDRLLSRIVDTMIQVSEQFRRYAHDRLDPFANTQHGYVISGRLMIRNDSSLSVSSSMYGEFIRPHDHRLLEAMGTGSIHSCGNWQHLVGSMLEIPALRGMDFGNPEMMDIPTVYRRCRERKVAMTHVTPARRDLACGNAKKDYPTGAVFVYLTEDLEDAAEVLRAYIAT